MARWNKAKHISLPSRGSKFISTRCELLLIMKESLSRSRSLIMMSNFILQNGSEEEAPLWSLHDEARSIISTRQDEISRKCCWFDRTERTNEGKKSLTLRQNYECGLWRLRNDYGSELLSNRGNGRECKSVIKDLSADERRGTMNHHHQQVGCMDR